MKGFLLAAGFGTRLWPLSDVRAKPAFPYRGTPLIMHCARLMQRHGVTDLWVNTHHLPESIRRALDLDVHVVHETEILGTGGALANLADAFQGDSVLVMNAKVVTDIDLSRVITHARGVVTMVCVPNRKREVFTDVQFDQRGVLTGFSAELSATPHTYTGIQVLQPEFFDYLPGAGFSDTVKDVYPRILAAGREIHVEVSHDAWAEFSTLARYRDLHVGGFIDSRAEVDPSAHITESVVWENARIGKDVRLHGCIVADGVTLPPGFHAENAAIIQADRVTTQKDARIDNGVLIASIGAAHGTKT